VPTTASAPADTTLVIQNTGDRALAIADVLTERGLTLTAVHPSTPEPGYVTATVTRAEDAAGPLLLVGERHSAAGSGPAFSGDGPSARRLEQLLGAPPLAVAETVNLYEQAEAGLAPLRRAGELRETWPGRIVACGRTVARAFGLDEFLVWSGNVGAIPHPSGRCRYWNSPDYVLAAQLFLRPAVRP